MGYQYIGTLDWARKTGGTLSLKDRFTLLSTVLGPTMASLTQTWLHIGKGRPVDFNAIPTPDTPAIKSAYALLQSCANDSIINHSFRTYYWGAAFAHMAGLDHDPELFMASCLLHDLGMTDAHHGKHPGCTCFAVDGAMAAKEWSNDIGWPEDRQHRLAEAISLHMNGYVDVANGAEAHLLQQGATCDVVGGRFYDMGRSYRDTILERYPRLGLNREFTDFVAREARMRPGSRGQLMRLVGLPLMIGVNPFGG